MAKTCGILACDLRGGIGAQGGLPWSIPEDLARFKERTTNSIVVMGRKTYDSLPYMSRPLKNRMNWVVTQDVQRHQHHHHPNLIFMTMDDCREALQKPQPVPVYVIGGARLFAALADTLTTLYLTRVHSVYEACDVFIDLMDVQKRFPKVNHAEDHIDPRTGVQVTFETRVRPV